MKTIEQKAKAYDKALEIAKPYYEEAIKSEKTASIEFLESMFDELRNNDDEIRKALINVFATHKDYEMFFGVSVENIHAWLKKQGEKNIINFDEAEQEKADFVGDGFIECHANFLDFKEGNTYWLEYIGDDKYNVRSDNLLGKTYHITPCQLYTVFKKLTWLEKQRSEPNWCHHKVDLSNCSEEYRKAYYDGWNNCNMQHSQCAWTETDDEELEITINALKGIKQHDSIDWLKTTKWLLTIKQRMKE